MHNQPPKLSPYFDGELPAFVRDAQKLREHILTLCGQILYSTTPNEGMLIPFKAMSVIDGDLWCAKASMVSDTEIDIQFREGHSTDVEKPDEIVALMMAKQGGFNDISGLCIPVVDPNQATVMGMIISSVDYHPGEVLTVCNFHHDDLKPVAEGLDRTLGTQGASLNMVTLLQERYQLVAESLTQCMKPLLVD